MKKTKIYGPYARKDGRKHIVIVHNSGKKTTKSYARFLLEQNGHNIPVTSDVHHKDENCANDNLDNLEIIDQKEHLRQHKAMFQEPVQAHCYLCGKEFTMSVKQQTSRYRNIKRKDRPDPKGPFCSKSCRGKYGTMIQNDQI